MLGADGPKTISKTLWKGKNGDRLDVENPAPGKRPGQLHYQNSKVDKYIYDPETKTFRDAPNSINDLLKDAKFQRFIERAIEKYLGGL